MEERKEGWYWVRFGLGECDDWCCIEYTPLGFKISPSTYIGDNWLAEIGPRIPTPDEQPTPEMIDAGAQRLVNWACDDLVWPDSWDALDVAAARNDAERVIRSALSASGDL